MAKSLGDAAAAGSARTGEVVEFEHDAVHLIHQEQQRPFLRVCWSRVRVAFPMSVRAAGHIAALHLAHSILLKGTRGDEATGK